MIRTMRRIRERYRTETVVLRARSAQKFKKRWATLGFGDKANLDDGHTWPMTFALKELTAAEEARSPRS